MCWHAPAAQKLECRRVCAYTCEEPMGPPAPALPAGEPGNAVCQRRDTPVQAKSQPGQRLHQACSPGIGTGDLHQAFPQGVCTRNLHGVLAQGVCTGCPHQAFAPGVCIKHLHRIFAPRIYTTHWHRVFAPGICIGHLHRAFALGVCTSHLHRVSTPCTRTVCLHRALFALGICSLLLPGRAVCGQQPRSGHRAVGGSRRSR